MLRKRKFLYPALIWSLITIVRGGVHQDIKEVFTKVYSDSDPDVDLQDVNNKAVVLFLRCESLANPTEWIFDRDYTNLTSPKFPCDPAEWNLRWVPTAGNLNISFLRLRCDKLDTRLDLCCRSVANHSDNVLVKLEPNLTTGRLHISKQPGSCLESEVEEHRENKSSSRACARISVSQARNRNYWKCEGPDGTPGKLSFRYCGSSSDCANMQRKLKLEAVRLDYTTNLTHLVQRDWVGMTNADVNMYPAGVAVCEFGDAKSPGAAAVEFFFVGKDKSNLHFSLAEISMSDLIWFEPTPTSTTFYTKDKLEIFCKVSTYGLSADPRVLVTFNGSQSLWAEIGTSNFLNEDFSRVTKVGIDFDGEGSPGLYEIECSSLLWNTSEWASQTFQIEVRAIVPPYFDVNYNEVMVNEGDVNVRFKCDALGDPAPIVTWSHHNVPGVVTEGPELILMTASAHLVNGSMVSCTAENKYGHWANKTFKLRVLLGEEDSPISTGASIAIVGLVIVLLALGLGLGYLYFRVVSIWNAAAQQLLSEEEVNEFQQGSSAPLTGQSIHDDDQLAIECLPYNPEFDLDKEQFYVDFSTELGSGQYGIVYAGHITHGPDICSTQVAVKTVRPNVPVEFFKALMSELKILAFIGEHEHIARLVGAYSSNITNRELYVGIELCKSSLEKYLRNNATRFNIGYAETSYNENGGKCGNVDHPGTTGDLIRWSGEIAAGMEYLSGKGIVHADLAARNVLFSFDLRAKICDFGLARQLVNHAYIKKTKCYLPWKWMAIESLRHKHFSAMSDVWSFGVTCWEIFSLGEVPYPCVDWSWEFVDKLEAGNRLKKPRHASPEIFSILLQCWAERKERRPMFSELKQFFLQQGWQFANSGAYVSPDEFS